MPQPPAPLPFDLHQRGPVGFVVFETTESVALPLHALAKATLRGGGSHIALIFGSSMVAIDGQGLGVVLEHLLAAELKTIRRGCDQGVEVRNIQVLDVEA